MSSARKTIRQGLVAALTNDLVGVNVYDSKISLLESDKTPLVNLSTPAEDVSLLGDDFLHAYTLTVLAEIVVKGVDSATAVGDLDDLANLVRQSVINYSNTAENYNQFDLIPKLEETYGDQQDKKYFTCRLEFQVRYKSSSGRDIGSLDDFSTTVGTLTTNDEKPIVVRSDF